MEKISLNSILDETLINERTKEKLDSELEYYNIRAGSKHVGRKAYATSPFDPVKVIVHKARPPLKIRQGMTQS